MLLNFDHVNRLFHDVSIVVNGLPMHMLDYDASTFINDHLLMTFKGYMCYWLVELDFIAL